jgi:hypothetical protein
LIGRRPLVAALAVHFAATPVIVGGAIFDAFLANPSCDAMSSLSRAGKIGSPGFIWPSVVSGGIWLSLQASSMSGMPLNEALTTGVAKAAFVAEAEPPQRPGAFRPPARPANRLD